MSKARAWVAATAVLVLAVLGAGWALVISPQLSTAASAREEAERVEATNAMHRIKTAELKKQFEQIDTYKAELAEYRVAIPDTAERAELLRQIERLAQRNDVIVTDFGSQAASVVEVAAQPLEAPSAEPEEPADGDAEDAEGAEGEEPAEEAPAAPQPGEPIMEGLFGLPVTVTVVGPYEDVRRFFAGLSELDRTYEVASWAATSLEEAEPLDGLPAIERGWVELAVSGFAFVYTGTAETPSTDEPREGDLPRSSRGNPFEPIEGTVGSS